MDNKFTEQLHTHIHPFSNNKIPTLRHLCFSLSLSLAPFLLLHFTILSDAHNTIATVLNSAPFWIYIYIYIYFVSIIPPMNLKHTHTHRDVHSSEFMCGLEGVACSLYYAFTKQLNDYMGENYVVKYWISMFGSEIFCNVAWHIVAWFVCVLNRRCCCTCGALIQADHSIDSL